MIKKYRFFHAVKDSRYLVPQFWNNDSMAEWIKRTGTEDTHPLLVLGYLSLKHSYLYPVYRLFMPPNRLPSFPTARHERDEEPPHML
ncbi:hypothetical protein OH492_00385 [Vibrio chagasii]|nr:hypothetical protein [Vibrio chagasii]